MTTILFNSLRKVSSLLQLDASLTRPINFQRLYLLNGLFEIDDLYFIKRNTKSIHIGENYFKIKNLSPIK